MLLMLACTGEKQNRQESDAPATDTVEAVQQDSTLWGHLGEDTGMSALQLITDQGDTLELYRTSPYTGEDGHLMGEIRNFSDRFAVTLTDDGETMLTAINATQFARQWTNEQGTLLVKPDGTVESQGLPYHGWQMWNGHLLLTSEQQQEYGTVVRTDTMNIVALDDDSLVIRDHINQLITFYKAR